MALILSLPKNTIWIRHEQIEQFVQLALGLRNPFEGDMILRIEAPLYNLRNLPVMLNVFNAGDIDLPPSGSTLREQHG